MKRLNPSRLGWLTLCLGTASVLTLAAEPTFTKVVDSTQVFPGSAEIFTSFAAPVIAGGQVAFEASAGTNSGVFLWNGTTLLKAADFHTAIPETGGTFTFFSGGFAVALENGVVTFRGQSTTASGFYQFDGTNLTRLVDTTTALPGGPGTFRSFGAPSPAGGQIAFIAQNQNTIPGIFQFANGTLTPLLPPGSLYPGGGAFAFSSQVALDNGNLAFWGAHGPNTNAIFTLVGDKLTKLAERDQTLTPGGGVFTSVQSPPDISGGSVVFQGGFSGGSGLYRADLNGGNLTALVTTADAIPGGTGNFTGFQAFEYIAGELVFRASGADGQHGLYRWHAGTVTRIIDRNTLLDGKNITNIAFRNSGFAGDELAFSVTLADSSRAIYTTALEGGGGEISGGTLSAPAYSAGNGFTFTFSGTIGQTYRIQYTSQLATGAWLELTNFTYSTPLTILDPATGSDTTRYYRAIHP